MTALFYAYMDSPIGRLLMLSDGEYLTNLDCELEQTTPNPNWILRLITLRLCELLAVR